MKIVTMYRAVLSLLVFGVICSVSCSEPTLYSSTVLDAESYLLYSSIYRNSNWLAPDEVAAVAAKPLTFKEIPARESCLSASTEEERRMVDAASNLSTQQSEWKRQFDFGHAYALILPSDTDKAIDCVSRQTGQKLVTGCEPYVNMRFVRFLSIPVFDRNHTRALVAISRICGGLCGDGSVRIYQKSRNTWKLEPNSFAKCLWKY